jgi:uncharacterized glyoxalase superfamily protein PhnB
MSAVKILSVAPYLLVEDVRKSADWYKEKLGFSNDGFWGEPPCFTMVRRDSITIMLKTPETAKENFVRPNFTIHRDACWDAYLRVAGVETLFEEFTKRGVKIKREPEIAPYGMKDFDIEDCNGYVLCFGEDWQGRK